MREAVTKLENLVLNSDTFVKPFAQVIRPLFLYMFCRLPRMMSADSTTAGPGTEVEASCIYQHIT